MPDSENLSNVNKYSDPRSNRMVRFYRRLKYRYVDDFVFIHITKNGGTSIERALQIPRSHDTALGKREKFGRSEWDRRFTFTLVRNPFDKVVSNYHYVSKVGLRNFSAKPVGFKEWVRLVFDVQDPFYHDDPKVYLPQFDWISDRDGQILVDFVGRFETIYDDFAKICKVLGKKASLPHINASKHRHYRDYYDDASREIVAHWYRKDIQNFGYQF